MAIMPSRQRSRPPLGRCEQPQRHHRPRGSGPPSEARASPARQGAPCATHTPQAASARPSRSEECGWSAQLCLGAAQVAQGRLRDETPARHRRRRQRAWTPMSVSLCTCHLGSSCSRSSVCSPCSRPMARLLATAQRHTRLRPPWGGHEPGRRRMARGSGDVPSLGPCASSRQRPLWAFCEASSVCSACMLWRARPVAMRPR